ncbi:HK97-gp10 family putative phage morphogenesis protein [Novosphingobium sp. BL-8A]|uniref:HK97-gp10 family putative phage morphogenesis protein n=1 Tax=Novosphingobium sp. BL-8A TaxID=3127639 RepID=UPI003757D643
MPKSRLIGAKAHAARLKKLTGETMVREVGRALFAAGELIQAEAQVSITAGSVSGKNHTPSAPGSPPNNDSSVLRNNIETNQVAPLVVEVSSNAPYAAAQEFGNSRLPARPYMAPARDAKKKEVTQLVRKAVDRAVKRSKSSE